jgi:hypothetical protein
MVLPPVGTDKRTNFGRLHLFLTRKQGPGLLCLPRSQYPSYFSTMALNSDVGSRRRVYTECPLKRFTLVSAARARQRMTRRRARVRDSCNLPSDVQSSTELRQASRRAKYKEATSEVWQKIETTNRPLRGASSPVQANHAVELLPAARSTQAEHSGGETIGGLFPV